MLSLTIVSLAFSVLRVGASHRSFSFSDDYRRMGAEKQVTFDPGLFTPLEDLSQVSNANFTTLLHPAFPAYSIRIKRSSWCDETVRSYTGYLDIQARHLFFSFFESRDDPKNDDVILWTNGGPGCSSSLGLLMELGPCQMKGSNETTFNLHSWNSKANIFFLDQPIGVGFSYAEYGEIVTSTEDAAKDVASFVQIFFEHFSDFKGRAFHLAGESYGGHYLPIFGGAINDQNLKVAAADMTPINLTSVIIGNGLTDYARMITSYYDIQCTGASIAPFQDIATCVRMKQAIPRCELAMKSSCVDEFDLISCGAAVSFCDTEFTTPFSKTGRNPYDVSKPCEGDAAETLCYNVTLDITTYLNRPETRKLLGVDPSVGNWKGCSDTVSNLFLKNLDPYNPLAPFYVAELLERGVKVLLYVGTYDMSCNWVGNERFSLGMEWSGQKNFAAQPLREWKVDGKPAGLTRSGDGLTFVTIQGAGHMVPHDKPVESLEFLNRWLTGHEL